MSEVLLQKIGVTVDQLAQDFLTRKVGDRIPPIREYQQLLQVSQGTIQNALNYLKESGAVTLEGHGHLGTFIQSLDYRRLQECCLKREFLGSMPLPYSSSYRGLATALFEILKPFTFNLVYARGAESRLKMVTSGLCQFTICSRYAAEEAIRSHPQVAIAVDLGPGTYLARHVLVLRDPAATGITEGMRVAYDQDSLDQRSITGKLTDGIPHIHLVEIKAHQTVRAILNGEVDAGVWNYDDIVESGYQGLNVVPIDQFEDLNRFSSAVLVVNRQDENMARLLRQYIQPQLVQSIQQAVREGIRSADY